MAKSCSICSHKKRYQIDQCLVKKVSYREITEQFNVGKSALSRHVNEGHIQKRIRDARDAEDLKAGKSLQARIDEIYDLAISSAKSASCENDYRGVGACLTPAIKVLEIISKGPEKPGTPQESALLSSLQSDVKETFKDDVPVDKAQPQATQNS